MRQTAAGLVGARRIDGLVAFLDVGDLAVLVDHESGAVGDAELRDQHAILLRNLSHVVTDHGIAGVEFLFPVSQRWREIGADRYHLRFICIKFCDTRLVRGEFARSTTGERGYEEGQNDDLLPAKIGKLHGLIVGIGKREIGSFVPDLEMSLRRRDLLSRENGRECQERTDGLHVSSTGILSTTEGKINTPTPLRGTIEQ